MTAPGPTRTPGYRGALPPREDTMARPWILTVIAIFVLILVLSILGVPSRFIPDPTPIPVPTVSPLASPDASPASPASPDASPTGTPADSPSVEPSPTDQ